MIVSYYTIMDMSYKTPFTITNNILTLCQDISRELGILAGSKLTVLPVKLRKENKIRTIHYSLAK